MRMRSMVHGIAFTLSVCFKPYHRDKVNPRSKLGFWLKRSVVVPAVLLHFESHRFVEWREREFVELIERKGPHATIDRQIAACCWMIWRNCTQAASI